MKTFYLPILTIVMLILSSGFANKTEEHIPNTNQVTHNDTLQGSPNTGHTTSNELPSSDTSEAITAQQTEITPVHDTTSINPSITDTTSATDDNTTSATDDNTTSATNDNTTSATNIDTINNNIENSEVTEHSNTTTLLSAESNTVITNKKDIKRLIKIAFLPKELSGSFLLKRKILPQNEGITYTLHVNNTKKWGITVANPNPAIETIITSNTIKAPKEESSKKKKKNKGKKEWHRKSNSNLPQKYELEYHHTPWTKLRPFWKTDTLPKGLLSWFQWDTGGSLELRRDQFYNFRREGDTIDDNIDLMKPSLVGYNLEMSYRHKIKFFYVGGGFTRHSQDSKHFDTLFTKNENWMRRLGWQLHVAVPGFKYEIYRDPRLIPEYGCHDRKVFENLYEENAFTHEFLYKVHVYETSDTLGWKVDTFVVPIDTVFNGTPYKQGDLILDSTALTRGIWIPPGVGHKLSVKVGFFNYTLLIDPYRYRGPIQTYLLKDLPFFKANWDMGLIVLPNGRVIPTGAVDFYTFRIPIKGHGLHITPLRFTFQIASRREFYIGLSFKSEFKPNFSKRKKERVK